MKEIYRSPFLPSKEPVEVEVCTGVSPGCSDECAEYLVSPLCCFKPSEPKEN